ncbi:MAG TPA: indole-3-glycerol phosphate synthase TrpC [Gemmatimonadales bacterium]|jgi:indole-3-glycerol phosphate synthase
MPVSLNQILASTREQLPSLRSRRGALERAAAAAPPPLSLRQALRGSTVAVIAEVKRRSPSAGTIREDLDPARHAAAYADAGAAAISVLTDGPFFGGSLGDLHAVAERVDVPVLRKDFILDELQVLEARAAGGSAVLLIVRALEPSRLRDLLRFVVDVGLESLVEIHTAAELDIALGAGADIVGVNSRDLDTFTIDTVGAWKLVRTLPAEVTAVAESGMASVGDVAAAADVGADAVLIGTALSAATDPGRLLSDLIRVPRRAR